MHKALRVVLSVAAVVLLVAHVDVGLLRLRLARADVSLVVAALAALLGSAAAGGLVWASVFPADRRLGAVEGMRLTLVGFSINNLVPTGVAGDVYRAWAVARRGWGWALACYTVLMDRWCSFLVLLTALAGAAVYVAAAWPSNTPGDPRWALSAAVGLLAVGFGLATVLLLLWGGRLPGVLAASLRGGERFMPEICARMRAFVCSRGLVVTFALATLSMGLEALCILLSARALGAAGPALTFLVLAPVFRVMHRVPGFVNAIGPQEMAALAIWGGLGQDSETALSISFVLHALRVGVGLLGVPLYTVGDGAVASEALARAASD